jgi:hypothetical protein
MSAARARIGGAATHGGVRARRRVEPCPRRRARARFPRWARGLPRSIKQEASERPALAHQPGRRCAPGSAARALLRGGAAAPARGAGNARTQQQDAHRRDICTAPPPRRCSSSARLPAGAVSSARARQRCAGDAGEPRAVAVSFIVSPPFEKGKNQSPPFSVARAAPSWRLVRASRRTRGAAARVQQAATSATRARAVACWCICGSDAISCWTSHRRAQSAAERSRARSS